MNPEPQKTQQIIRDLRREIMQLKASAVTSNLNRHMEAKIESPKKKNFRVFKEIYRQHRML